MQAVRKSGQSLELYFVDGRPEGLVTAEMFNWTGHVLLAPRTFLAAALDRAEADRSGVYILTGESGSDSKVYVGEGEDVGERLRAHLRNKDWWDVAVLVTAADNRLNKAHIRYLEASLIHLATASGRALLDNGTAPPVPSLSEADRAKMESFLSNLLLVLPALRVDVFEQRRRSHDTPTHPARDKAGSEERAAELFVLDMPQVGLSARAELRRGELVVLAGSTARGSWSGRSGEKSTYYSLYQQLRRSGALVEEGDVCRFTEDTGFNSPSAAAAVIAGRAANGPKSWRNKASGLSWADWEARSLPSL